MTALKHQPLDLNALHSLLAYIDASVPRGEWVTVLMAIKSEFGDTGQQAALDWSSLADNFNAKEFQSTWKSIKSTGGVNIGTLIHQAKANGWTPEPMTKQERKRLDQERKQRQAENAQRAELEAQALAEQHQRASETAYRIIENAQPAPATHPYLMRKQIANHGVLFGAVLTYGNALIIPVYGTQSPFIGEVQNVQTINAKGGKYFLPAGKKAGGYYPIQWVENAPIVICEGFATGATLAKHYCPEFSVLCAFDAGNLKAVAVAFREANPKTQMIIAGDNDWQTEQQTGFNPGKEKAIQAAQAVNGLVSIPTFADDETGSDWNDRYLLDFKK